MSNNESTIQPINSSGIQLLNYVLCLADTNLILAQRNAECCAHGPILEQDIAITNISLDLLGQGRNFYQYAATLLNENPELKKEIEHVLPADFEGTITEDTLAYLRNERDFKNLLITELPNGDWGQTVLRQFFYSAYQYSLYEQMQQLEDAQLAAIAAKSIKEVIYHLKWSSEWVIRLGDGTAESQQRMLHALDTLWSYTGELFIPATFETNAGIDLPSIKSTWTEKIKDVLTEATLPLPFGEDKKETFMHSGGKQGMHTEYMGFILAEMQSLQRTYPGATW